MTSSLTKKPKDLDVRVHDETERVIDSFRLEGDLQDVKRALRRRQAHKAGRKVTVWIQGKRGRRILAQYHRSSSRGPWLRSHTAGGFQHPTAEQGG